MFLLSIVPFTAVLQASKNKPAVCSSSAPVQDIALAVVVALVVALVMWRQIRNIKALGETVKHE